MRSLFILIWSLLWLGCFQVENQRNNLKVMEKELKKLPYKSTKDSLFNKFLACISDTGKHRIVGVTDMLDLNYDTFGHDRFYQEIIEYSTNVNEISNMINSLGDFNKLSDTLEFPTIRIMEEWKLFFICQNDTLLTFKSSGFETLNEKIRLLINGKSYLTNYEVFFSQLKLIERKKKYIY